LISNIETAHSIFNLAFLLQKKLMRPVIGKSGEHLSPLQVHVLDALQHRTPATMTSLANEVWMPKQQLTGIVTKLVKRGIAQRDFDPDDRRVVRISLTTKGGALLDRIRKETLKTLNDKLAGLGQKELSALSDAANQLADILDKNRLPQKTTWENDYETCN
jgi:DNA-binding MarR family transcriptional regulator